MLLGPQEPPAVSVARAASDSPFLLTCDHASNRLPAALGDLGVPAAERDRHIAWDIGALGVAGGLSAALDATLVASGYSRLVIDLNRPPHRHDLFPEKSENTPVPGNVALSAAEKQRRRAALFEPYHETIARLLDARAARGLGTLLVAIHSFTPVYAGVARPWEIALLSNRDRRVAECLLRALHRDHVLNVGDNIPYRLTDDGDYGVPVHGERRGLPHVLIELRQDTVAAVSGQRAWVARLAPLLREAWAYVSSA
ncbi:MAG TPA: N-formylglutamate amidohydrolase [Gammaproteobacteria bacterium]|nr:N-formylglutamate amidohydrolase [Gammaproteobacteria bacterium]